MQAIPTFEELTNSNIYKRVKMEDIFVNKKYIMFYLSNNKAMYINVIENNENYFGYECLTNLNKYSITSYKNIFVHYFLFYKEINNRDVRELKFLSHLSSRNINVNKGLKTNILSSLDLSTYISTFLEEQT